MSVAGVLYFRYTRPDMYRPIKVSFSSLNLRNSLKIPKFQVNLFFPITFVIICAFLIIVPVYVAPYECGMGLLITLAGIPIYYVGVQWKDKPEWFQNKIYASTYACQKLFMSAKEDKDDDSE